MREMGRKKIEKLKEEGRERGEREERERRERERGGGEVREGHSFCIHLSS